MESAQAKRFATELKLERELRAAKGALVEQAKARVRELQQLRAMIDNQMANANEALDDALSAAKE